MEYPSFIQDVGHILTLPPASVIVLGCHFLCFPLAILFGRFQPSLKNTWFTRDNVSSFIGVTLLIACFQWESLHLFIQWFLSYITLRIVSHRYLGFTTFAVTYGHVLIANVYKYIYRYGEYHLDYTGTLMLATMRMSSLAFAVADSRKPREMLTQLQREHIIEETVSLGDHFNYYFSFTGILFGPITFYDEHKRFVNKHPTEQHANYKLAIFKFLQGIAAVSIVIYATPFYPMSLNYDDMVISKGFLYRNWIMHITVLVARWRYYFVWLTSESMCLFAGYDSDKKEGEKMLTAAVNPVKIELATSLKTFFENWNMFAARWLRYTCYERVPKYALHFTFFISGLWHGFMPGYAITFTPLIFYSLAGRKLHKVISPKFQSNRYLSVLYACITWLGTMLVLAYSGASFSILHYDRIVLAQTGLYCYPYIITLAVLLCIPKPEKSNNSTTDSSSTVNTPNKEYLE